MDNDETAAATIAAVAAAAAASHHAHEQFQQQQQRERQQQQQQQQQEDVHHATENGTEPAQTPPLPSQSLPVDHSSQQTSADDDGAFHADAEQLRKQTEEAAQQAVEAAAAAHEAHQQQEQQRQQQQQQQHQHQQDQQHQQQQDQQHQQQQQQHSGDSQSQTHSQGNHPEQQTTESSHDAHQHTPPQSSSKTRSAPSPSGSGHPKRRKINTCLQCKARKVKCDKARPLCGPCKKHGVVGACTWAAEGETNMPAWQTEAIGPATTSTSGSSWPPAAAAAANAFAPPFPTASTGGLNPESQAMIERIARLEAQLAHQRAQAGEENAFFNDGQGQFPNGTTAHLESLLTERGHGAEEAATASQHLAAVWSNQFANASESERGMAADALAMIAQHHPSTARSMAGLASSATNLLSGIRFPFSIRPTPEAIREALNLLPTDDNVDFLLNSALHGFLIGVGHCASPRLVNVQMTRFKQQRDGGDIANIDVSLLALLFHLLVLAADVAEPTEIVTRAIVEREENISGLIELWQSTGEALLSMADFTGSPSLNCLMALTAGRHFYASQGRMVQTATTMALAIRIAQCLGLHRLGSARDDEARWLADVQTNTSQEPNPVATKVEPTAVFGASHENMVRQALMPRTGGMGGFDSLHLADRSHLVREAGRRIWYFLVTQDWIQSSHTDKVYHAVPGQWDTAMPLNLNEADLPDGTGPNPYKLPPELAPGVPSDGAIWPSIYSVTKVCADICDAYAWGKTPSYRELLGFDAKWRKIIDDLPVYLRLDGESEHLSYVRDQEQVHPHLATSRFMVLEAVHHRLLILHRAYLIRGHTEAKYAPSVKAGVDAARMVIFCRQTVQSHRTPITKFWPVRLHAFNAAMLLCMHLMELTKKGIRDTEETTRLREEIAVALSLLEDGKRTNAFPSTDGDSYSTAKHIINRLVQEVDSRNHGPQNGTDATENLEGLYTHAGDTSEDHGVGGGGGASASASASASTGGVSGAGSGGSTNGGDNAFPPSANASGSVGAGSLGGAATSQIDSDLERVLFKLINDASESRENTQQAQETSQEGGSGSQAGSGSEDSDSPGEDNAEQLWRLIDAYARPSFV